MKGVWGPHRIYATLSTYGLIFRCANSYLSTSAKMTQKEYMHTFLKIYARRLLLAQIHPCSTDRVWSQKKKKPECHMQGR